MCDPDMIAEHEMTRYSRRATLSSWAKHNAEVFDWCIAAFPDLLICGILFTDVPDGMPTLAQCNYPLPEKYDWIQETHPCIPSASMLQLGQQSVFLASIG